MARKSVNAEDMCNVLGGEFNKETGNCTFEMDTKPGSVFDQTDRFWFFLMQIVVGLSVTVFNIYYAITLFSPYWWASATIVGIEFALFMVMTWYKTGNWNEALARGTITVMVVAGMSILVGVIYYWDWTLVLDFFWIADIAFTALVYGIPVSMLLSILLLDAPEERFGAARKRITA